MHLWMDQAKAFSEPITWERAAEVFDEHGSMDDYELKEIYAILYY